MLDSNLVRAPLHYQLSKTLEGEIASGHFKQGDLFATERSLVERYGVSSTTVKRALQDLVQRGYLFRRTGKGTFVRRPSIEEPLGLLSSFYEEMQSQGIRPGSDVLIMKPVTADPFLSEKLQIAEGAPVFLIRKLMRANDEPMAIFESYWLPEIGQILTRYDLVTEGIFHIVEGELGIQLGEAEATIEAAAPTREETRLLLLSPRTPVLTKTQVIYTSDGKPVNIVRLAYRGDRYKFRTRMVRQGGKYISRGNSGRPVGDFDEIPKVAAQEASLVKTKT
jgi:GntR family transcriptional regulator